MLASISPVGEASRQQRWPVTATAYLVGSTLGGALLGLVGGALGVAASLGTLRLGDRVAALVLVGAVGLAVALDRRWLPLRVPAWQRQVDERWLTRYRGWVYGAGFGFQLGAGLLTRIPTALTWVVALAAVLLGASSSLTAAILVGVVYGGVRASPMLAAGALTDPARLNAFHHRLERASRPADLATSSLAVATATAVVAVAFV